MLQDSSSDSSGDEETTSFQVLRRGFKHTRTASDVSTGKGSGAPSLDMGVSTDAYGSSPARNSTTRGRLQPAFSFEATLDSDTEQLTSSLTKLRPSPSLGAEEGGGSLRGSPSHQRASSLGGGSRGVSPSVDDLTDYVVVSKGDKRASAVQFEWQMIEPPHSEDEREGEGGRGSKSPKEDNEDLERKKLYLLVARCIAFPFNAKYQIETTPPRAKLNRERFGLLCRTLRAITEDPGKVPWEYENKLTSQEQDVLQSSGFLACVEWMLGVVLSRREVVDICNNGGFSMKELETIFKVKATVIASEGREEADAHKVSLWCNAFRKIAEQCSDSVRGHGDHSYHRVKQSGAAGGPAAVLNQDKLYKVFQEILKIRSIEHQILYKECQLGNPEEQEAVVRRELQARKRVLQDDSHALNEGKFGSRKVENIYREEQLKMVKLLNSNLDQLSLQGTTTHPQERKKKLPYQNPPTKKSNVSDGGTLPVAKQDLTFNLKVKVTIHEVSEVQSAFEGKPLFCVFGHHEGKRDPFQTQPVIPELSRAVFGEEGEFWVSSPTPQVKLELRSISKSVLHDSRLIAKHVHTALPSSSDIYSTINLYKDKETTSPVAKLRISTIVERPSRIKKCGYLYSVGSSMFKQKKKRFFTLIQLTQYKFLFCSYQPNGTQPKESLALGQEHCVEYATDTGQLQPEQDAKYLFDLVFEDSEMGRIHFGCRDDAERQSWIEWMVRGTGQSLPTQQLSVMQDIVRAGSTDLERYGLKRAVDSVNDTPTLEPHKLFIKLFRATLDFRLQEDLFSRGLFSPAQMFVLDEFCARYGVRDPFRHLTCLQDWLDILERGVSVWPVMIQSSFCFCQMHVGGMNPPEKSVIVTSDEREAFVEVCQRIEEVVTYQLQNFRYCFPFCCPKGDLRTTLKLFDLVSSINHTPQQEPVSQRVLTLIMEKGALINYKQVFSKIDNPDPDSPLPISQVFDLSRFCIDFMYELHDFYWEEFNQSKVFTSHVNAFWAFFLVDMREAMQRSEDTVLKLQLFHVVNKYFSSQPTMRLEEFHQHFLNDFTPVVIKYIDTLENTLKQDLAASLAAETWMPVTTKCCEAVEGAMKALLSFKRFLQELDWPEGSFAAFLDQKVAAICADRFQEAADVIEIQFSHLIMTGKKGSTPLNYTIPPQVFTMINTLVYLSSQVMQVCASQRVQLAAELENDEESSLQHDSGENIEDHLSRILNSTITMAVSKLCNPLQDILTKLTKFDPSEGFLASLKMMIPTSIPISGYTEFLTANLTLISSNLVSTIFDNFVVNWYECQMQLLNQWLEKRPNFSLHKTQLTSAEELFQTLYRCFVKCEVAPQQLRSQSHDAVQDRIEVENSRIDLLHIGKD